MVLRSLFAFIWIGNGELNNTELYTDIHATFCNSEDYNSDSITSSPNETSLNPIVMAEIAVWKWS